VETRLLVLNADPVFDDRALAILHEDEHLEIQVVRNLSEAVQALLDENFDGSIIEGEAARALEEATHIRQHFPSLTIACLLSDRWHGRHQSKATEQNIQLLSRRRYTRGLRITLTRFKFGDSGRGH
jgi:hypothetical protein